MSSTLISEARWFGVNYALLNAIGFGLGLVSGTVLLATSRDGTIPGWSGAPIEQVFWYAVGVVFYTTAFFGLGILAIVLAAWRLAIHVAGHPRAMALLEAAALIGLAFVPFLIHPDDARRPGRLPRYTSGGPRRAVDPL